MPGCEALAGGVLPASTLAAAARCRRRDPLNDVVARHTRWGFWKCFYRLRRAGHGWNHKRVHRVHCALRLNLPRRTKRRVPARIRQPLVWALDFMIDALYDGRGFRTLNVLAGESLGEHADRGTRARWSIIVRAPIDHRAARTRHPDAVAVDG